MNRYKKKKKALFSSIQHKKKQKMNSNPVGFCIA